MYAPANGRESDMATEEDFNLTRYLKSPSPPPPFLHSLNSMVVYQRSGQSMDDPLQNQQQHEEYMDFPCYGISQRRTNSGESDMATEDFDAMIFLDLPPSPPPPYPSSSKSRSGCYKRRHSIYKFTLVLYSDYDDGLPWRKYGQKSILCAKHPRHYYRCTLKFDQGCQATKQVQKMEDDPPTYRISYHDIHTCGCQNLILDFTIPDDSSNSGVLSGEVEAGNWGERTEEAEIAEAQLNSDTLQASGGTFDTNTGLVEEISPSRFLLAAQQVDPDEDFVDGEVEPGGNDGEGTKEAEIAELKLNSGPSGKRKRKEKTPRRERGNKKTTGVRNVIPLEDILQVKGMLLKDAVEHLKEAEIAESQLNPGPSRKKQRKEKTPTEERENKKTIQVKNVIPLDEIVQVKEMNLKGVAKLLKGVRLENPDENSCNDEVEAVGMGGVGTGEGEVKEGELNCGSSDKGERNEKTPRGERASNKTTGVKIEIPLEEILKYKEMCRKDAAARLKVSESTLKRICRGYNISRWSPRELNKLIGQSHPKESPLDVDQEQIHQLNCDTELRSDQASIETNSVSVKAKYETVTIKFRLSRPWRKVELEENVKKRLGLEFGTYHTEYKDEDGDLILISCDEDLKDCIPNSSPMGTCSIQLFLRQSSS